jgi:hypothetical protein
MHEEIGRRVGLLLESLDASAIRRDLVAVVVAGSAARNEERWSDGRLLSDIDVMVITRSPPRRIDRTLAVDRVLAGHASDGIEGGRIPLSTLRYATLAHYEARHRGIVVRGDPAILLRIPMAGPADIPLWEAVRLTANRLFEHLKYRAGITSAESVALKSYEAIGEAQLVLERRYQPTFRERVDEMQRRPLRGAVADAGRLYEQAERMRSGDAQSLDVSPERALQDLLLQLESALGALSGREAGLDEQLAILARTERHLSHRAYWMLREIGYRPTQDPVIRLWRDAVRELRKDGSDDDPGRLVRLWQRCPQILRSGNPT